MRTSLRRGVVALVLSVPLVLGVGVGAATAAPTTSELLVPVVTGPEFGPAGVPGGLVQTIPIKATVGEKPGEVRFAAADIRPYYYQFNYRFLTVNWRNLATGAVGAVDIRNWEALENPSLPINAEPRYPVNLPLEATAQTGAGPVVVMVTHNREQWQAPPASNALIPGLGMLFVP